WSKNLLPGYYGQTESLYELFGYFIREPADLFVQEQSDFPDSWKLQFHYMSCEGPDDKARDCRPHDRDLARDYDKGQLYHFSFVHTGILSPGSVPEPFGKGSVPWCTSSYVDAPSCTAAKIFVRNSFLKVSATREYEPVNWVDSRFDRHGYFRLERPTI